MAYVDWGARVVYIDRSELTEIVADDVYGLDTTWLWQTIHDLEDDVEGMNNPDIMRHSLPYTLSGVTYARAVEIINGYRVQFTGPPPPNDYFSVVLSGGNNNVADVFIPNPVSVISNNSAGLAEATATDAVWNEVLEGGYTARELVRIMASALAGKLSGAASANVKIRDLADSKNRIDATVDPDGNRIAVSIDATE